MPFDCGIAKQVGKTLGQDHANRLEVSPVLRETDRVCQNSWNAETLVPNGPIDWTLRSYDSSWIGAFVQ
ncbi:MAG TPA: hypothetical protein DDX19_19115 [Rhodopirellula baltica]|nr:hypothetical protein [Rhodopirellula baltica]